MSLGSERREIILTVSPSALLMESVLSSEPSASKFSALQAPQLIRLVCLPSTGTRLKQLIFLYMCYHIPKHNALNKSYYDHQFKSMHATTYPNLRSEHNLLRPPIQCNACYHIPKHNALNTSYYDHQFNAMHATKYPNIMLSTQATTTTNSNQCMLPHTQT